LALCCGTPGWAQQSPFSAVPNGTLPEQNAYELLARGLNQRASEHEQLEVLRGDVLALKSAVAKTESKSDESLSEVRRLREEIGALSAQVRTIRVEKPAKDQRPAMVDVDTTGSLGGTQLTPGEAKQIKRAEELMGRGDIAGARLLLEYSVRSNKSAPLYRKLAETYDPDRLATIQVLGNLGDRNRADELYEEARRVGALDGGRAAQQP
jgi:hypothetical protein